MLDLDKKFFYDADGGCGCGTEGCDGAHDVDQTIVMVDTETGEEFTFEIVDDFVFEDETYTVLVTVEDGEEEAEWVIARVVTEENGEIGLESLTEEEGERVYDEYERILAEEIDEDDEGDED